MFLYLCENHICKSEFRVLMKVLMSLSSKLIKSSSSPSSLFFSLFPSFILSSTFPLLLLPLPPPLLQLHFFLLLYLLLLYPSSLSSSPSSLSSLYSSPLFIFPSSSPPLFSPFACSSYPFSFSFSHPFLEASKSWRSLYPNLQHSCILGVSPYIRL